MTRPESRFLLVDGIRTHYLEAGSGDPVILLHSGEFGGCAELSWEFNIPAFAERYRVIAPDWLGYGQTDKIHDFALRHRRMLLHMRRFLEVLAIDDAAFVGSSMAGGLLLRDAATEQPLLPANTLIAAPGGGISPDNPDRRATIEYDCTIDGIKRILRACFHSDEWVNNDDYAQRRYELSLIPGAWECAAAARFTNPLTAPRSWLGQPDDTPYETIQAQVLFIAGANDRVRLPDFATELHGYAKRIPTNAEVIIFDECGHLPAIEKAEQFNETALDFLKRRYKHNNQP
jgi:pimeloyl-ACP methyl ester carboxylesterase